MKAKFVFCASLSLIVVVALLVCTSETGAVNLSRLETQPARFFDSDGICRTGTSFLEAAARGDLVLVKQLVAQGESLDVRDCEGNTALHLAMVNGQTDVVAFLIRYPRLLFAVNADGLSPHLLAQIE